MAEPTSWIIGSDPASDLVVDRPSVSWRHCRLTQRSDGSYWIEDLGSTNGTYINGRPVRGATPVRREDQITLGFTVPFVWPAESKAAAPVGAVPAAQAARVIRVGRDTANDVVIDSPEVSARHARIKIAPGGREGVVEDLGSTNGTSIGAPGNPIKVPTTIGPGDIVYFGPVAYPASAFFPADSVERRESIPDLVFRGPIMIVGRDASCDRVVDFPVVSGRHARFVRAGGAILVEDLGSSNGTYVNGTRVDRTASVKSDDLIGLGSCTLRFVDGSADVAPAGDSTYLALPLPERARDIGVEGLDVRRFPAARSGVAKVPAVSKRALVIAGIGLGAQAGVLSEWVLLAAGRSTAAALFGLALAGVWFGLTSALFERLLAASAPGDAEPAATRAGVAGYLAELVRSLGLAAIFDLTLCLVLFGIASARIPFPGRWPQTIGTLWLAALVGSAFGLVLARATERLVFALAGAVVLITLMAAIGGPNRALATLNPAARTVAAGLPSRWAFEALLLSWAGERALDPALDPVEPFFPRETERAGMLACALALFALLGAGIYLDALIALTRPDRPRALGSGMMRAGGPY
jgi:pSer/pThr/pTyr-binding forkhead associated (FHA) protein